MPHLSHLILAFCTATGVYATIVFAMCALWRHCNEAGVFGGTWTTLLSCSSSRGRRIASCPASDVGGAPGAGIAWWYVPLGASRTLWEPQSRAPDDARSLLSSRLAGTECHRRTLAICALEAALAGYAARPCLSCHHDPYRTVGAGGIAAENSNAHVCPLDRSAPEA